MSVHTATSIKEVRKELGLTQREFADKLGVTRLTVIRWEQGKYTPDRYNVDRFNSVTGIKIDRIVMLPRRG